MLFVFLSLFFLLFWFPSTNLQVFGQSFCFDRWRSTGAITIDHHVGLKGGGWNGVTSSSVILYLFNNMAQPPQGQRSCTTYLPLRKVLQTVAKDPQIESHSQKVE